MKKLLASTLWPIVVCICAFAQGTPSWLRYPTISPDGKIIVFTCKGDLYRVPANGGTATPLTSHEAHDFMPVKQRPAVGGCGRRVVESDQIAGDDD
jgi:hypothetical protein